MFGTFHEKIAEQKTISRPGVARFNPGGSLDLTFGNKLLDGVPENASWPLMPSKQTDGCLQADGKILIIHRYQTKLPNSLDFVSHLTRLNSDGSVDKAFGTDGTLVVVFDGAMTYANNVQVQIDGKIIVSGCMVINTQYRLTVARYDPKGDLDLSFGVEGYAKYVLEGGENSIPNWMGVHQDKIWLAGFVTGPEEGALLMRYDTDGQPDEQFNGGKPILTNEPFKSLQWNTASLQEDAGVIVVGTEDSNPRQLVVKRFNEDGSENLDRQWQTKILSASDAISQSPARLIVAAKKQHGNALVMGLLINPGKPNKKRAFSAIRTLLHHFRSLFFR